MITRRRPALLACTVMVGVLVASCGSSSGDKAADPAAQSAPEQETDRQRAADFSTILKNKDMKALDEFLSPAFQLQRTDGTEIKKAEYLEHPSTVDSFELLDVSGTRYGNTRVIRFVSRVTATINGKSTTNEPAPRLATFVWNGKRWQLISYANYVAYHPPTTTTTTTAAG